MAFEGYMSFKGKTQGQFKGSVPRKQGGHPVLGGHPIIGFKFGVESPRDASSGLPSGKRQHSPLVVTREVDSSSPVLFQACLAHVQFDTAELVIPTQSAGGRVVKNNKIELTNGLITHIALAPSKGGKRREAVTLEYEGIKVNGAPRSPQDGPQPLWWHDSW
jgi:type VI secretion system secreted protein Hcp